MRKFTAVYGGEKGGSREGGGGTLHHHVCRNVGKFSPLFIFVIIKQITFNLGDSTTWSMSQVEKNRERVFQQFIFVYSEAMKFHFWLKNSIYFASQANELIMNYRF